MSKCDPDKVKPLCYLAGPYTHPDPVENTRNTIMVASKLLAERRCTPYVPHLTMLWHLVDPKPIEDWYAYDLEILRRCDVVLRLPGRSKGADAEVDFATSLNIPVVWGEDELENWLEEELFAQALERFA